MGVYQRPDSPFHWLLLERPGQAPIRESTMIPKAGTSPAGTKEHLRQATELYNSRMVDLARRRHKLPIDLPARTFAEHSTWYLVHVSKLKRGYDRERSMVNQLLPFWRGFQLAAVTRQDGLEWLAWRSDQGVKGSTVNREKEILIHLFNTAVGKYIDENPLAGLGDVDEDEFEIRIFTEKEEQKLLAVCTVEERALILTGLHTLQRLGSVTSLKISHDRGDVLRFMNAKVKSKAMKGHDVDVAERLRKALDTHKKRLRDRSADAPLFPSFWDIDDQRRRTKVWTMMNTRCAAAGIKTNRLEGGVSFHALRHTGATRMLRAGVDPKTVMEIGGWRRIEQVLKYVHSNRQMKKRAVNAVHVETRPRRRA
jgi:integrase